MKVRNFALCLVVCAVALPTFAAGPVKAGKWETTMQIDMPNMPMKMPPITTTHCITKEQAEKPENAIPTNDRQKDCKISDVKVDGKTVSWTMTCDKPHPMTGSGSVIYSDDSYSGVVDMKMEGDREMHLKYSGKRLGDCE